MTQKFKLLLVLWLVAAYVGPTTTEGGGAETTTESPATADPGSTATGGSTTGPTSNPPPTTTPDPGPTTTGGNTTGPTSNPPPTTTPDPGPTTTGGNTTGPTSNPPPTTTPDPGPTTTGGNTTGPTANPPPTTTPDPDPCGSNPCLDGSTCERRTNQTFACLCLPGVVYNYETRSCEAAKVFPGVLSVTRISFSEALTNTASPEFQQAAELIIAQLDIAFKGISDYEGSTVLKLEDAANSNRKVWSRSEKGIRATVEIVFKPTAEIQTKAVTEAIKNATECDDCVLNGATFTETDLCKMENVCDYTAICTVLDGSLECNCHPGYIKDPSGRACTVCPFGHRVYNKTTCTPCPFGRTGLDCSEHWKLALVIVGSLFGALLVITAFVLPVVLRKKKSKNADSGKPYISHSSAKAPPVNSSLGNNKATSVYGSANAFANAGVPRIPRATTNLEMTPSNSRQNLIAGGRNFRQYDDEDDFAPYAQTRPQSNPYAQNRPQNNPYASSQGHANPYYAHDNGKRINY